MKASALCTLLLALPTVWGATLTHNYDLTNSLNDLVGSDTLTGDGGLVTASGYVFAANQGLTVSSALTNTGNYSIVMDFSFHDLGGYRKILDFEDLTSDLGLYNLNTALDF